MQEFRPEEYINPADFIADILPDWTSLVKDENKPLGYQLQDTISSFVWYPDDVTYQVVTAYLMLSQKWCKVVPILFSYGLPGSGKSTLSILGAYLHNQEYTFSSSDTFPSIRNALDQLRWIDEDKQYEKDGAILCWDNLATTDLKRDPRLYQLLLFGYNRSTDKVMIANTDGTNKVFHVFCPKIISSVEPLHQDVDFQELSRRLLIVNHKKIPDGIPIESINDYDFRTFPELFFNFWYEKLNCLKFVSTRKTISKSKKWQISETQKVISIDLATMHSLIYETTNEESINVIGEYLMKIQQSKTISELEESLDRFMQLEFARLSNSNIIYVKHSVIKDYLTLLVKDGIVQSYEVRDFKKILRKLGYKSTSLGWFKNEEI